MLEDGEDVLADALDQRGEGRGAVEARPDRQHVDEEADQPGQLGVRPARDVGADHEAFGPAQPMEQGLEAREQHDERRGAARPAQLRQTDDQRPRQFEADGAAGLRRDRRPRPVGRQGQQGGHLREVPAPERGLGRRRALHGRPVPAREIRVLDGEGRRLRAAIGGPEFGEQHADRPAVADEVVEGQDEAVIVGGQAQEPGAQERRHGEVERRGGLRGLARGDPDLAGARIEAGEVVDGHVEGDRLGDPGLRKAVLAGRIAGPQHGVPGDDPAQGRGEPVGIQRASEPDMSDHDVGAAPGRVAEPLGQPEPLLAERQQGRARIRQERGRRHRVAGQRVDPRREVGEGRGREQVAQRQGDPEGGADAVDGAHRQERVAAEFQETAPARDLVQAEEIAPDRREGALRRAPGRLIRRRGTLRAPVEVEGGEVAGREAVPARAAPELPARGLGQGARRQQGHEFRRLGQHLRQRGVDRGGDLRRAGGGAPADLGGDPDRLARRALDREGRDPPRAESRHARLDCRLHVLRIDVVAAQDDEVLGAPGDEELAAVQEAEVPGPQPGRAVAGHEGRAGRLRVVPVAARDAGAAEPDLADRPVGAGEARARVDDPQVLGPDRPAAAREGGAGLVGDGAAGRQRRRRHAQPAPRRAQGLGRDEEGRLGEAVGGAERRRREARRGEALGEAGEGPGPDRLGTAVGDAPPGEVEPRQRGGADALAGQPVGEVRAAADRAAMRADRLEPRGGPGEEGLRAHQHERRAGEDRLDQPRDQAHVVVEGQPGDEDVVRAGRDRLGEPAGVGDDVAVRDLDALGIRGRARRVLQEGEGVGRARDRPPRLRPGAADRVDADDRPHGAARAGRRHGLAVRPIGQDVARCHVGDHQGEAGRVVRIPRLRREGGHGDEARVEAGEERHDVVRSARQGDERPRAGLGVALEARREGADPPVEFRVVEGRPDRAPVREEAQGQPVGRGGRPRPQDRHEAVVRRGPVGRRRAVRAAHVQALVQAHAPAPAWRPRGGAARCSTTRPRSSFTTWSARSNQRSSWVTTRIVRPSAASSGRSVS